MDETLPGDERDGYVFPEYEGRCIARVPGTAAASVGADVAPQLPAETVPDGSFEHVVICLLDGLGLERYRESCDRYSFFDALSTVGRETPLTSVYPSETAAAVTTLHTGRTPAEHGLLGWNLRLPEADLTCQSLPFLTREADYGETIDLGEATDGAVTGRDLFDGEAIYERLAAAGVESEVIIPGRITGPHGDVATAGAGVETVNTVGEFGLRVRRRLAASDGPSYHYAYWPEIDGASHDEGTRSDAYEAELAAVAGALEREFARLDPATARETLVLVTADHGHHDADPGAAVDLTAYPEIWSNLATHADGRPVLPTGGPRNLQLHLADGTRETVRAAIRDAPFEARVLSGERAIESGLFGPGEVSPKLRARVGDLVVVPDRVNVWFDMEARKTEFVGTHGGQHPREMYVPFVAASAADLRAEL